jgi:hypothetical protein
MRLHAYAHTRMSGDADIGPYADILTDTDTYPYRILAMIMIMHAPDHDPARS